MKNRTDFFIVRYVADGKSAPFSFDVDWIPELPEFHYPSGNPSDAALSRNYVCATDLSDLVADYLPDHYLASEKFKKLCEDTDSEIIFRPVEVRLKNNKATDKGYFFLLVAERVSFMDKANSNFALSYDKHTKQPAISVEKDGQFDVYEKIEQLSINAAACPHLFFAREIKEAVCSDLFVSLFKERGLVGIDFERIDESYKYTPWEDF